MSKILFIVEPFIIEPLGIAYLAAALKRAGHRAQWLSIKDGLFHPQIEVYDPDFLAYSVTTGQHRTMLEAHRTITTTYRIPSVWGGPHPTLYPEFIEDDGVDTIIRGEAEQSFIDWLENPIKGVIEPVALQHIDDIEPPDRDFLYEDANNYLNPIKNVMTSRGCPYNCPYCFNSTYRKIYKGQRWVRHRAVDHVIDECTDLKRYPLKMIYFQDDEFLANPNLEELLVKYADNIGVDFHCQIRIELLTDETAELLVHAGCTGVTFAVESGNDEIRTQLLSRKMSKETILAGCEILHRHGLKFRTENMVGLPNETLDQMLETLDLNIACRPELVWASIFQPYPKCKIADYCIEQGLWDGKTEAFSDTFFDRTILNTPLKHKINRLQKLTSIIASWPVLRPFTRLLISLPLDGLYRRIYKWWKKRKFRILFKENQ